MEKDSPTHSVLQSALALLSNSGRSELVDRLPEKRSCGDDLFVCEFGSNGRLLDRDTTFVGSSRLTRKLDEIPGFFDGLLKVAIDLDRETDVLLTADGVACDAMVRRVSELFRVPLLPLVMAPTDPKKLALLISKLADSDRKVGLVFDSRSRGADFALASIANQMVLLSVRTNGNLQSAVDDRLNKGKPAKVLVDARLTKKAVTDQLLAAGATGWYLFGCEQPGIESSNRDLEFSSAAEVNSDEFLLHWTRRRVGPWPEQSEAEFLDDLIFRANGKDHREVATLRRILATERILASNALTRDPRPVVCFSDVTFTELKKRRVFRSHLSRWDFEPFGIAIRKSWLASHGAAAVVYGDETKWDSMEESKRPFFQLNDSSSKVDWSVEKEWRIVGDVDLRKVPVDAAMVFVATRDDAAEVAGLSRWPVVVLEE
ncbi:hypothetical protein [Mariniblastus fucicola]|uniref:Uncharacterized protein n=1 Tax=Mariniblastus fucicola TaxID=980251 RepID=A0A5B9PDN6_9BACT|nr:hypothetical protein [Mariniblastus fucicola]QEG23315.1 hypothetical protein MFFC18_32110 [Mariniblastus fucicola]